MKYKRKCVSQKTGFLKTGRRLKRGTALLLAAILSVSGPIQSVASVEATKGNTPEKNQQILEALQAITGDGKSAQEIYSQLKTLELFDEEGNLITEKILVDGEEKTVWEVLDMIQDMDEEQLDQTVMAAGRQISFRDLKTMAEIEAELSRIQSTYFNENIQLTDAQNASLDSLYRQLETEGISIQGFADADETVHFASGIDRENVLSFTSVYIGDGANTGDGHEISVPNGAGTVNLNVKLKEAADYPVYFRVRALDGSAKAGTNYKKEIQVDAKYLDTREEAEAGDESVSCMIPAGETSVSITVEIQAAQNEDGSLDGWKGDRVFFLEFTNPENTSFVGETSYIYKVGINGNASFEMPSDAKWSGTYYDITDENPSENSPGIQTISQNAKNWLSENRKSEDLILKKSAYIAEENREDVGWGVFYLPDLNVFRMYNTLKTDVLVNGIDLYPDSIYMGYRYYEDDNKELEVCREGAKYDIEMGPGYTAKVLGTTRDSDIFCDPDWPYTEEIVYRRNVPVSHSLNMKEISNTAWNSLMDTGAEISVESKSVMYVAGEGAEEIKRMPGGVNVGERVELEISANAPRIISAKAQPGHYQAGGKIPVLVELSHPIIVKTKPEATDKMELIEDSDTSSRYLTVLVNAGDKILESPSLEQVVNVTELFDFLKKGVYEDAWQNTPMTLEMDAGMTEIESTDVDLVQNITSALNAGLISLNLHGDSVITPDKTTAEVRIPLSKGVYRLLADTGMTDEDGNMYTSRLAVSADGEKYQRLYFTDDNGNPTKDTPSYLIGTVPLPVNIGENDINAAIELYLMKEEAGWEPEQVAVNLYVIYTRQASVLMTKEHMEILYPDGFPEDTGEEEDEIFLDTENIQQILKLDWRRKSDSPANLTWPDDISWTPADEESKKVASIDKNGQISLTGNAGQATFVLTAENGGFTPGAGEEESLYQIVSKPIRAGVGNTPFLLIPQTSQTVSVQAGQPALIMWQTNLFDKNSIANGENRDFETNVTLKLFKAVYNESGEFQEEKSLMSENQVGKEIVLTGTQNSPVNDYSFMNLEKLQEKGRHSYVFTVEMEADEAVPGEWPPMKAVGYIDVSARPASIAVSRPDGGLYQTDEAGTIALTWNTADIDPVEGAEAYVAVTDNETGERVFEETYSGLTENVADGDKNGRFSFPLKVEEGFRTTYTVEAKIKNTTDIGWSTDSYQLNLYKAESLKLLVNGEETTEGQNITISNRDMIAAMDSEEILALDRQIFLEQELSINYDEYNWQDLEDRMKWNAESLEEGMDAAEIQTLYGSKYYDIRELDFETYSPSQEQLLVGLADGTARVTVEHQFTSDLNAGVNVEIQTLKDQLYLFQFYPMQETSITYVNGEGDRKKIVSNDKGEAAIYEPSGISQDVYVRSESDSGEVYMGTIYRETLATSEKDAGSLELYPLNVLQLKKASSVSLAFRTPDGNPYQGKINVHGGVLINGEYRPEIKIDHEDGAEGYTITPGKDGKHVFEFDMTEFPEEYTENAIRFILEFQFENNAYEPVYQDIDGTINSEALIRMSRNMINLKAHDTSSELQPVTVHKRLFFNDAASGAYRDVLETAGRVGPGTNHPAVTMETIAAWWGNSLEEASAARKLVYLDEYGKSLPFQTSELLEYPFLSMPFVKNTMVIDKKAMEAMELDTGESLAMELSYRDSEETVLRQETSKLRIVNMLGVEDVTGSERLSMILREMTSASGNNSEVKFANGMAGIGMTLASTLSIVNTENLRLQLLPTADPTRFQGFVSIGLNNMVGDNVTGLDPQYDKGGDLDYLPGITEAKGLLKNGLANTVKDEKNLVKYAGALLKDQGKRGMSNGSSSNGVLKDGAPYYALQGYFETEVFYNYENKEWEMAVLNGGFTAGGGYGRDWKWNSFVGPVPVLAELGFGAGIAVDFQAAVDRQAMVNEYLTELRIMAYLRAFAGIGFDYAIIALKLGLYGQINLDVRVNFLNSRDALSTPKVGVYAGGSGEFGILFAVKFLFVSYQKILVGVSGEIGHVNNATYEANLEYWEGVKNGKSGQDYPMIVAQTQAAAEKLNTQIQQIPRAKLVMRDEASDMNIYEIPLEAALEERDYLELFDRSWNLEEEPGFFGRLAEGAKNMLRSIGLMKPEQPKEQDSEGAGIDSVWTNAYPYANPKVSADGRFLAYLTDQGEADVTRTRVAVRDLENGSQEQILDNDGFGDNYLSVSGAGEQTVMAWSRTTINLKKDPGSVITDAEQNQMMASAEIMVSRWNKEGEKWETRQLTENTVGDVSPAVATNGTRTVIAWRRGAGTDSSQVTNFDARDEIVYRVYDSSMGSWTSENAWSTEQILYNGTSGTTSGLEAAMLPDGTAGLVFAVDTARASNGAEAAAWNAGEGDGTVTTVDEATGAVQSLQEIMFATISKTSFDEDQADSTRVIRVTSDEYLDENPQIAAVGFTDLKTGEDGGQRFVLGWHSLQSYNGVQQNDIQLRAFSGDGLMEHRFPSAVSKVSNSASAIPGGIFRFSKGAETLEQLSILWKEPAVEAYEQDEETGSQEGDRTTVTGEESMDYDVLRAMQFTVGDGGTASYGMTAAQVLASMGAQTVIENFDPYLKDGKLEAMILGSCYDTGVTEEFPVDFGAGTTRSTVSMAKPESRIYRASGTYKDKLTVDFVIPDYRILYKNSKIPVQIGVTNQGTSAVSEIRVDFEDTAGKGILGIRTVNKQTQKFSFGGEQEPALLLPGESRTLTAYYQTGDKITDVNYTVSASFTKAKTRAVAAETENVPQIMKLDIPELAITDFRIKKEQDGKRLLQISLYNGNEAKLAETEHERVVKLGLYTDAECTNPVDASYLTEIQTRSREQDGAIKTLTWESNMREFAMIDDGTYTVQYEFDIARFIQQEDTKESGETFYPYQDEDGEIRESGIDLYAKVWVEDEDQEEDPAEFITSNNAVSVHLESLIKRAEGELASVSTSLKNPSQEGTGEGSQVTVTVQNNSIKEESSGNLIVTLLDANGKILEAKQLYNKNAENNGLMKISGEGVAEQTFTFSKIGTAARAYYSNDILDQSTKIKDITLEETDLGLSKFTPYSEGNENNIRVADIEAANLLGGQLVVQGNNAATSIQVEGAVQVETSEAASAAEDQTDAPDATGADSGWYIGNVELQPGKVSQIVIHASEENQEGQLVPVTYIVNVINRYVEENQGIQLEEIEKGGAAA